MSELNHDDESKRLFTSQKHSLKDYGDNPSDLNALAFDQDTEALRIASKQEHRLQGEVQEIVESHDQDIEIALRQALEAQEQAMEAHLVKRTPATLEKLAHANEHVTRLHALHVESSTRGDVPKSSLDEEPMFDLGPRPDDEL